MATVDLKKLTQLLESGEFYTSSRATKTPLAILNFVNQLCPLSEIEARHLAHELGIAENTCRIYVRWLASQGLVWAYGKGQGAVLRVKSINVWR